MTDTLASASSQKVGLLPYVYDEQGKPKYLIHLPKAKKPAEQPQMQWGLIRGTKEATDDNLWKTALREGMEEGGIRLCDIKAETRHGPFTYAYASHSKGEYPIPFYCVELKHADIEQFRCHAKDAQNLTFMTLEEIEVLQSQQRFKAGYMPILWDLQQQITAQVT